MGPRGASDTDAPQLGESGFESACRKGPNFRLRTDACCSIFTVPTLQFPLAEFLLWQTQN